MAIGFTPKHIEEFPLNELTIEEFLVLAHETVQKLKWKVSYNSGSGLIAYTDKGIFSRNAEIKIKIEFGIANLNSSSIGNEMMDGGKNKKNILEFKTEFNELKASLTKEEIDIKYQELKESFPSEEDDLLQLPPATTTEKINDFFSIFVPTEGYYITPILINLNLFIFILMTIKGVNIILPDNQSLLNWGANFKPLTLEGEWWRLLTNCFLHIGIMHLLFNMYALIYIGVLLEPILGKTRFISAYLLTGVIASVASLWWHDLTISAGASGAIFGMYGVFLALLTTNFIEKAARKPLLISIVIFVIYNLLYGMKGGIDNAAHIGGLLSGLVIGYAFIPSLKNPLENKLKYTTVGLLTVLLLTSSAFVYKQIPNEKSGYNDIIGENNNDEMEIYISKMEKFSEMELMALEVYNLSKNTPKEILLVELKERGIYYWNENITLIESLNKMNLPSELKRRNKILKEYCKLRIKSYELIYNTLSEETEQYNAEIEDYNRQIESKIKELGMDNE